MKKSPLMPTIGPAEGSGPRPVTVNFQKTPACPPGQGGCGTGPGCGNCTK